MAMYGYVGLGSVVYPHVRLCIWHVGLSNAMYRYVILRMAMCGYAWLCMGMWCYVRLCMAV